MINTREEIIQYVKQCTQEFDEANTDLFSAHKVADKLIISRSLASQYLNELQKDGIFIKIATRPVLFFDKETLEELYNLEINEKDFLSIEEFLQYLKKHRKQKYSFEDVVGSQGSLKPVIDKLIACIKYPGSGLPVMLLGETGTGKEYIINKTYKYALSHRIIPSGAKLIKVDVELMDDSHAVIDHLFGNKEANIKSKLLLANQGIVHIKNSHLINAQLLKKLLKKFNSLEETIMTKIIMDAKSNEDVDSDFEKEVPMNCYVPRFYERFNDEKEEFVYYFFKEEAKRMGLKLFVNVGVIQRLMKGSYIDNIKGLENEIKIICANAHSSNVQDGEVKIYSYHLTETLFSNDVYDFGQRGDDLSFVDVSLFSMGEQVKQIEKILADILEKGTKILTDESLSLEEVSEKFKTNSQYYFEFLKFNKQFDRKQLRMLEAVVSNIVDNVLESYGINEPVNFSILLSQSVYFIKENRTFGNMWKEKNSKQLKELLVLTKQSLQSEYEIVERVAMFMHDALGVKLDDIHIIIYTHMLTDSILGNVRKKCSGLIISHGYSTATSIADAVNLMMHRNMFDAIDMPIDITTSQIIEKIKKYLVRTVSSNDLLIMVDMGSLQDIGEALKELAQGDIAVINNVSTALALEAGYMILQEESLIDIVKKVEEKSVSSYTFIENRKSIPTIVFTSENGVQAARRMSELFIRSLPKTIDVSIENYNYFEVCQPGDVRSSLDNKNVLFVFGLTDPKLDNIPFVSIEDIMSMNKIDKLYQLFSYYLTGTEINEFKTNLMKNFSLENVMRNLTILDPTRLLESVSLSVDGLQKSLNKKFSSQITMGLYIHISCLIERLVTKATLEYGDETKFTEENGEFIRLVKQSFKNLLNDYGIDLPLSEIIYLYDYIAIDTREEE